MNALGEMTKTGESGGGDYGLRARPGDPEMGENFERMFTYLMAVRKPVIAAVNGACAGLGLSLACMMDMRFVERQSRAGSSATQLKRQSLLQPSPSAAFPSSHSSPGSVTPLEQYSAVHTPATQTLRSPQDVRSSSGLSRRHL